MSKQKQLFVTHLAEGGIKLFSLREKVVVSTLAAGCSADEVGQVLGVTKERVRQIAAKAERRIRRGKAHPTSIDSLIKDLKARNTSPREIPINALTDARLEYALINRGVSTLGGVVDLGCIGLLRTPNIGRKRVAELRELLSQFDMKLPD